MLRNQDVSIGDNIRNVKRMKGWEPLGERIGLAIEGGRQGVVGDVDGGLVYGGGPIQSSQCAMLSVFQPCQYLNQGHVHQPHYNEHHHHHHHHHCLVTPTLDGVVKFGGFKPINIVK